MHSGKLKDLMAGVAVLLAALVIIAALDPNFVPWACASWLLAAVLSCATVSSWRYWRKSRQPLVHHFAGQEFYAANNIRRGRGAGPEDGLAGSRVPRPTSPKPPSLNARLHEPRALEGDRGQPSAEPYDS